MLSEVHKRVFLCVCVCVCVCQGGWVGLGWRVIYCADDLVGRLVSWLVGHYCRYGHSEGSTEVYCK